MARFAIIKEGRVVNYAEADSSFAESQGWISAGNSNLGDLWNGLEFETPPPAPGPSQFDMDKARYEKRAAVKDELLAWMAADNMSRVRSGVWTVQDLTALLADPSVSAANQFMSTLSFELAAQAISQASTPLLTPAIRADWVSRLQSHFYLVP